MKDEISSCKQVSKQGKVGEKTEKIDGLLYLLIGTIAAMAKS